MRDHSGVRNRAAAPADARAGAFIAGTKPLSGLIRPLLQTKLAVGGPRDRYERKTDRMANDAMRVPEANQEALHLDFDRVRVHTHEQAVDLRKETNTRVSTASRAVPMMQRWAASGARTETASTVTEKAAPRGLIVEDATAELDPSQMRKSDFLAELRAAVRKAAEDTLAGTDRTTEGCPYLDHWFDYYSRRSSGHIERAVHKYAPEASAAASAGDTIPIIAARVRRSVEVWVKTGRIPEVQGTSAGLLATAPSDGVGDSSPATDSVLSEAREGNNGKADNPQWIQARLGSGRSLDTGVKSRMESAFNMNFSGIRVHTDTQAADLSNHYNARAFTVGEHIAFGSSEYRPGTLMGDALIAHELAHTVQQRSSDRSVAPMEKESSTYQSLEADAEKSAIRAVAALWSGVKDGVAGILRGPVPRLRSGLRLSRCDGKKEERSKKNVTVNVTYLEGGSTDLAAHLSKANDVFKQATVEVKSGNEETLDETRSKAILGDDLILDEFTDPASPTAEETALLKENRSAGMITMYYVKGMSHGSLGEAFLPSKGHPAGFVYASTNARTWPHELGHVLLDAGGHPADADNFMAQTSVASGKELMTEDQITKIRSSSFVK